MSSSIEMENSNNEKNKNVVVKEGNVKSISKEYVENENFESENENENETKNKNTNENIIKDENLIKSIYLLKEYTKDVALKYSSVTSDINVINLTLVEILKQLQQPQPQPQPNKQEQQNTSSS